MGYLLESMRKLVLLLFFISYGFIGYAQSADSLELAQTKKTLLRKLDNKDLSPDNRIKDLHELGKLYFGEENDSAYYYLNSALGLAKLANDSLQITKSYVSLSLVGIYTDDYDSALPYIDSTLIYAQKENPEYYSSLGWVYSIEGMVFNNYEKMDLAFEKILLANRYLEKAPENEESHEYLTDNYNDLSIIYFNIDNYANAEKYAKVALQKAKEIESAYYMAQNYNMLGTIYNAKDEYGLAERYLDSASTKYEEADDEEGKISITSDLGYLYRNQGLPTQARRQFLNSLSLSKVLDDPYTMVNSYLDLANSYLETNELNRSKAYLDSAQQSVITMSIPSYEGYMAILRAQIYEKENNIEAGITELKEVLEKTETNSFQQSKADMYGVVSRLYKEKGDYRNSLAYFERYSELRDTLQRTLQNEKLNILRVEQNYNQLVSELEQTESSLKLANIEKQQITTRNYLMIGIALLTILFSVFIFFRQRKLNRARRAILNSNQEVLKLKKEALDTEMRFKNKQITEFAIHISEKNELLEKIKSKLKGIKVTNDTYKEMVHEALHFINGDIEQNKEKVQLYQHIDETTDSFGAKIDQLYPNLSAKEKKVAIMLRLGQTSKQIGLQLNISPASVDNYRYNLRKKMEIPKGQSLKSFVQNL